MLIAYEPNMALRLNYFPIVIFLIIVLSLGLSFLADIVISFTLGSINRFRQKVRT